MRALAKRLRDGFWRPLRFRLWKLRLRSKLRRCDAKLIVDAPHGAVFSSSPVIRCQWQGEGGRTFTLRLGEGVDLGRHLTIEIWAWGDNVLELGDHVVFHDGIRIQMRGGTLRIGAMTEVRDVGAHARRGRLLSVTA